MTSSTLIDKFDGKLDPTIWRLSKIDPRSYRFTDSEDGKQALEITVTNEYRNSTDGLDVDRAEIAENQNVLIAVGNSVSYSFLFYFPTDFCITNNRLVFAQWKRYTPDNNSPMLSARYIDNCFSFKVTGDNLVKKFSKGIDLRGKWHQLTVNYALNQDLTGFAKGWLDEDLIMDYRGKMDYDPAPGYMFFKMGLYRDTLEVPQRVYFRNFQRST